jgi:uncharacterized protein with FMN-binding domain
MKKVIMALAVLCSMALAKEKKLSPKEIASEVGPAAEAWSELQQAYFTKTGKAGSNAQIGYTPPGASSPSNTGETEYFRYEAKVTSAKTAIWKATAKKAVGECKDGVWTITFDAMSFGGGITGAGCEELTSNEPSPKEMVSELGPVAGVWSKLQQAYSMETGKAGSNAQIGYTPPGASSPSNTGETRYFRYEASVTSAKTAIWKATAKRAIGECKDGVWTVTFDADNMTSKGSVTGARCEELTPNFTRGL